MGSRTLSCSEKVGISVTSCTWTRSYGSAAHTWVWNSFTRFAHLAGRCAPRVSRLVLVPAGLVACTIPFVAPAAPPIDGGVCALRRWKTGKELRKLVCCFMEVPSRTKQDGDGGKEQWLALNSAGAFSLPRYASVSVPNAE